MSNEAQFHTPGEAIVAVENALDYLADSGLSGGSGRETLELIGRARKASGRFVSLVSVWAAEADRAGVARTAAGTTVADWLTRTGNADPGEAIGLIRDGQTLLGSPTLKDAATSGTLTPRQLGGIKKTMRELPDDLTKAQRQQAEQQLLEQAKTMTPSELGRQAKGLAAQFNPPSVSDAEAQARELEAQRKRAVSRRYLTMRDDQDGSWLIEASLPYLEGEKLRRLVAGYLASAKATTDGPDKRSRTQRNADGLIALIDNHGTGAARLPGLAGDRPRIVVTMNEADVRDRAEQGGFLISGQQIDPGTLRRLCCDAELIPVVLGTNGVPLDMGAAARTVTPELRLALSLRDGRCLFPGCDAADEECEAHHIVPWWLRKMTCLENLVLLCPYHHTMVEPPRFWTGPAPDQWTVSMVDGIPQFTPPAALRAAHHDTRPGAPTLADTG